MDEFNHINISKKINNFIKPNKKGHYKEFFKINKFLRHLLSCHIVYKWEYNKTIKRLYNSCVCCSRQMYKVCIKQYIYESKI